jgi:hypothetical protein
MSSINLTPDEAKTLADKLWTAIFIGYTLEAMTNIQSGNIISFDEYVKTRLQIFLKNVKTHDDIVNIIAPIVHQ